jgi:ribonuclease HI
MGRFNYYNAAYRGSYEYLYHEHHQRKHTIYKRITSNHARPFAGTALPHTSGEGPHDIQSFRRDGHMAPRSMAVYCTDGAGRNAKEDQCGMLASAVSYLSGGVWKTETASLPRYSGHVIDAELYALKMAFDLAVRNIIDEDRPFTNVLFFSDSQDTIKMLAGMQDTRRPLGLIPTEGRWALENVYDAADKLAAHGTKVIIAWVKGHGKGERRAGNRAADAACTRVIKQQIQDLSPSRTELSKRVNCLNGDMKNEALWRLSEPFFRWGTGRCWIAPSLKHKAIEEE